jgi:starch phosphorylase
MNEPTRISHPKQRYMSTDIEGFDALAELALDMRSSWNHATDQVWRRLDPILWELTQNPWVVLQTVSREKLQLELAPPSAKTLTIWCKPGVMRRRRPRGSSKPTRNPR